VQPFLGPKFEQKINEDLEQVTPIAASPYRLTEPAVNEPENTKPSKGLYQFAIQRLVITGEALK
jgi:hypothetical protein